ncbi:T9SS type A sorting domain-containing protein [Polaribacter pectinis]|uniref:T9SS type A sorting domain-containing protein n=1 Tax=Polaribacter pectinis TaxID=2738844 RepID=A0A7G9L7U0_9FLAO|nr:chondroitinase-B domain-containing protein [Polaribacter pectinis]QNM84689.1 T9SS type A sorting domain-containing protein [Polaribacter pectinis]
MKTKLLHRNIAGKMQYSKINLCLIIILCFSLQTHLFSQTYTDAEELEDAVNGSTNGGTFVVKNGSYNDFEAAFEKMATEANPILVKAETVGGVTLTGGSSFRFKKSAYITLEGFIFDGTGNSSLIKFEGCNNIRITRNVFELAATSSVKWVYIGGVYNDNTIPFQFPSHNNRIDHNIFQNKNTPGHYITIDGTSDTNDVGYQSQNDRIDHNYFKDNSPRAVNEQESIRIGWSEMSQSSGYTTVEFNLFENCDGDPEIVSVKSSDNIVRHNTFVGSYGTLSLRHGNRNRIEGNYFFGNGKAVGTSPDGATLYTGGIRVYGTDHMIINNYMEGLTGTRWDAPITLTMGDAIDGQSTSLSKHFRAERVTIAYNTLVNNTHGIEIGYDNNDKYGKDLKDIIIANNLVTGSENAMVEIVDTDNDQGDNISWLNNLMYPTGSATVLAGATTTSFDASEVKNENPNIVYNATDKVWRTTSTTPLYANSVTSETIDKDIEGQTRPSSSNPGADHFSTESIRYKHLTAADVGPNAYETDDNTESLFVSSVTNFIAAGESKDFTVTSNLSWSVTDDKTWITVSPSSGSNNGTVTITVSENATFSVRTGTVTVTAGSLTRTVTVNQDAGDPKANLLLINDASSNDNVTIESVFHEEVTDTKNNIAVHSLDKDFNTQWAGKGIGGEIVYNLGGSFDLALVDFASTNGKTYKFQIWVSTTGTDSGDYVNAFPGSGNLLSNSTESFKSFLLPTVISGVKYVKLIGYGQTSGSEWNTIKEIEFYKTDNLSVDENKQSSTLIYPIPANNLLEIKNVKADVNSVNIISLQGKVVISKKLMTSQTNLTIDTSNLANGLYFVHLLNTNKEKESKLIIVQH